MSEKKELSQFSWPLLQWFYQVQRDLPWRRTRDPYAIWVSEIMLQQTRVETVIPYYERFMERFPTVQALAEAPESEVLKHWEGLGYYSRVRNLQTAAQVVSESHGGVVPSDPDRFGALKGVGSYTRGAVLSIAYQVPEPAVDGNVMRVFARWFGLEDDIADAKTKGKIEAMVRSWIPEDQPGDFNQALMELGSQVCKPKSPMCERCPVRVGCVALRDNRQTDLPVKKKAKAVRVETRWVLVMTRRRSQDDALEVWVRQRPAKGLLANLWEFPHETDRTQLDDLENSTIRVVNQWQGAHVFSHIRWELMAYHLECPEGFEPEMVGRWFGPEEREQYAFAQAFNVIWSVFQAQPVGGN
jgi:A/G-specific adenine glycosylase